jgi:hypothetical protein
VQFPINTYREKLDGRAVAGQVADAGRQSEEASFNFSVPSLDDGDREDGVEN